MSSPPTLSYSLGASDISKIVDAILPKLSPLLPKLTQDQLYVFLHTYVVNLSKDKTFSNKDELDTLVKEQIVKPIVNKVISKINNVTSASPDGNQACGTTFFGGTQQCTIKKCVFTIIFGRKCYSCTSQLFKKSLIAIYLFILYPKTI